MAPRTERKAQARERRLAEERVAAGRARTRHRLQLLGGVVAIALIVAGVGIALSVSGGGGGSGGARLVSAPHSPQATSRASVVARLLRGIPQHGTTLGDPHAPVTFTEYGDLECSVCDEFALAGGEDELISHDVRSGRVKLVYRSLETATAAQGTDASTIFTLQQSAAYAAGAQDRAWNYILLFYREQGEEGSHYVTPAYLTGLARQIPGLDVPRWSRARFDPRYGDALTGDARDFASLGIKTGTPTLVASGPDGRTRVVQEPADYATVERMIRSVA